VPRRQISAASTNRICRKKNGAGQSRLWILASKWAVAPPRQIAAASTNRFCRKKEGADRAACSRSARRSDAAALHRGRARAYTRCTLSPSGTMLRDLPPTDPISAGSAAAAAAHLRHSIQVLDCASDFLPTDPISACSRSGGLGPVRNVELGSLGAARGALLPERRVMLPPAHLQMRLGKLNGSPRQLNGSLSRSPVRGVFYWPSAHARRKLPHGALRTSLRRLAFYCTHAFILSCCYFTRPEPRSSRDARWAA